MWRRLPGPWPVKLIESAVLLTGVVALMFIVVFPWIEPRLPFTDVTVDEQQSGADTVDPNAPDPNAPQPGAPQTQAPENPTLGFGAASLAIR
jgi:hypothetical protein